MQFLYLCGFFDKNMNTTLILKLYKNTDSAFTVRTPPFTLKVESVGLHLNFSYFTACICKYIIHRCAMADIKLDSSVI